MRSISLSLLVLGCLTTTAFAEKGLRFKIDGKAIEILPAGYSSTQILGFKRSGEMINVSPSEIKNPVVTNRFVPFSQSEARGELLREFGKSYEVTGTGSYLVVHPKGYRDLWANRFEQLHRSMTHFFRTRGYPMKKPKFPLIGIVFHSKSQYQAYCRRVLNYSAEDAIGLYMENTNRIYLFDATQGQGAQSRRWEQNLSTVMHEVAHQTAFNAGIHVRRSRTPGWIVEGLGCLFEAKGIYDTSKFKRREDRVSVSRLQRFRKNSIDDVEDDVMSLVSSDKLFKREPLNAYATSWALTFYLSERRPREYVRFLKMVAKHEPFDRYSSSQRVAEFSKVYGRDFRKLAMELVRYMRDIRVPNES